MKGLFVSSTLFALALSSVATADLSEAPGGDYAVDPSHAYITFTYSHLGFSTPHVGFDDFDVKLSLNSDAVEESKVAVVIDATSVNSRVGNFNEHLNGPNFFNTAEFPEITFTSTNIRSTGDDTLDVEGDLTIKGVTKSVTLATTINKAANHPMRGVPTIGMSGETTVKRSDFGLDRNVPHVGDEVTISVTAELMMAKDD